MTTGTVLVREEQTKAACNTTRNASGKPVEFFNFDEDYVTRLRNEHAATWDHFDGYFRPRIRSKLGSQIPWEMVDDVAGDVMLSFIENLKRGEPENPACLAGYVLQICQYKVLETLRKLSNQKTFADVDWELFPGGGRTPQQEYFEGEQTKEIQRILRKLKPRDQNVLLEIFYFKVDRDEVCQKYGVSREQLKLILCRARQRFQKNWRRS